MPCVEVVHKMYLLDPVGSCHLDNDLSSLLVEVAPVTTKTDGLALDLITQGVEQ